MGSLKDNKNIGSASETKALVQKLKALEIEVARLRERRGRV